MQDPETSGIAAQVITRPMGLDVSELLTSPKVACHSLRLIGSTLCHIVSHSRIQVACKA